MLFSSGGEPRPRFRLDWGLLTSPASSFFWEWLQGGCQWASLFIPPSPVHLENQEGHGAHCISGSPFSLP